VPSSDTEKQELQVSEETKGKKQDDIGLSLIDIPQTVEENIAKTKERKQQKQNKQKNGIVSTKNTRKKKTISIYLNLFN